MTDVVEISPQSWEYRLVAAVVYAVEQRAGGRGGPRTRWNGRVLEETDPENLGSAHADGSISVSVANVLDQLRKARDLDRPLTDDEAWLLRDAMDTLTHEAAHLMAPGGDMTAPEAYPYDDAAAASDEGRVEQWTKRNLDNIISDVFTDAGLDKVEAAVLAQPGLDAYAAFTPAARLLDRALAERSGLTSAQVTQKLLCADDAQRWNVAVDLVIDEHLAEPGLMPESHRAEVRKQLVAPLRESLSVLAAVEGDESLGSDQKAEEGTKAAQNAIAGLDSALNRIERKYRIDNAQRARQQAQRPASRVNQAVRRAQGNLPPDLKRLRALTAPQAPASGATRRPVEATDHAPVEQGEGSRPRGQQATRPTGGPRQPHSPQRD
ncbi:hypothetical protein [Kribbella jiaozuonensis]|uniref:Uncharacterized protein n=1 Tax=Kribbella jiaozuonensis TaxID=2575441 RepID=A0A4U3LK88_9ACTN|nr:hypothetical protein [Kribbella jiaozuonensis]TKK74587.1 hypothetical protein FDA38_38185 [Kribbella jiaozuonensis]